MSGRTTLEKAVLPLAAVIAWELAGRAGWLPIYLSRPSAIAAALVEAATSDELARALDVHRGRVSNSVATHPMAAVVMQAVGTDSPCMIRELIARPRRRGRERTPRARVGP